MGLFDGLVDSVFDSFGLDTVGDFAGQFTSNFLGGFSSQQPAAQLMPSYSPPPVYGGVQAYPTAAGSVPAGVIAAAGAVARYIPKWSVIYPNLWQAIQKLIGQGVKGITVEKLYQALRKYGPAILATWIGAAAVSDLIAYKTVRRKRRMNPANARALRRSLRRLHSFDRLSSRVKAQLAGSCRVRKRKC